MRRLKATWESEARLKTIGHLRKEGFLTMRRLFLLRTSESMPNCRLTVYAGAPHGLYITEVRRLAADLVEFINGG
jgi:hypothetical protein